MEKLFYMSRKFNHKGVALLYVLVLIFLLTFIAAAMIIFAYNSAKKSAYASNYEGMYYVAESALNTAEAIFTADIVIPVQNVGKPSSIQSENALFEELDTHLQYLKAKIEDEIHNLFPGVVIDIKPEVNRSAIKTRAFDSAGNTWISFFGGELVSAGNGLWNIEPAEPFHYTIVATSEDRSVEIKRSYTILNARFEEATPGSDGTGFWLSGQNLLNNGVSGWGYTIRIPDGLTIRYHEGNGDDRTFDPPNAFIAPLPAWDNSPEESVIQGQSMTAMMEEIGGHLNVTNEVNTIRQRVFNIIKTLNPTAVQSGNTLNVPTVTDGVMIFNGVAASPTPMDLAGIHTVWVTSNHPITLHGDFPALRMVYSPFNVSIAGNFPRLEAVYAGGAFTMGTSGRGFFCDASAAGRPLDDNGLNIPLCIFADSHPNNVNFDNGGFIKNAIIAFTHDTNIRGDSGNNAVYCDAQFYCIQPLNINLTVRNWNMDGVPSFITGNTLIANVIAENGFSGIMYAVSQAAVANINAPVYNGAVLTSGGFNEFTLQNRFPPTPSSPVDFYCLINPEAYQNLNSTLDAYFNLLVQSNGGGGETTGQNARYIPEATDGTPREERKDPAIIRETDVGP